MLNLRFVGLVDSSTLRRPLRVGYCVVGPSQIQAEVLVLVDAGTHRVESLIQTTTVAVITFSRNA
jgi:hypothetical protein